MSEDFLRLVAQANPAARYQPANGYPPASASTPYEDTPQLMDPFFDDDEDVPDSAFGRPNHPGPMDSQASGLPLTRNAVPPAGSGPSKSSGDGVPQGWNFDDEDFRPADQQTFAGSGSFNGSEKKTALSPRKKWKWPWQKDKVLTGDRVIALNNAPANVEFGSNFVSTSKYNIASFMPKFLTGASFAT
jgi:phospholipid-transporting ATPase